MSQIAANPEVVVISIGGSLVYNEEGLNIAFLRSLNKFIRNNLNNRKFFLVIGGGKIARKYQHASKAVIGSLSPADIDWLGIHSTHLNAHLVRTIFHDIASPRIIENYDKLQTDVNDKVVIAAGWKPGWSTDYCATLIAVSHNAKTIINLTNIDYVYDKDPNTHKNAQIVPYLSWEDFRQMVGEEWNPGANLPFDPIASRLASEKNMTVIICNGHNFKNLSHILYGGSYRGTTITTNPPIQQKNIYNPETEIETKNNYKSIIQNTIELISIWGLAIRITYFLRPKKVLNIGCGQGKLVAILRRMGVDTIGIDINEQKIKMANKEIRGFLYTADLLELPFEDDLFDLVISNNIMSTLPRPSIQEAINESIRVSSKYVIHRIATLDNIFSWSHIVSKHKDPSILHHNFWSNLFENLENIKFLKKSFFTFPIAIESIFLLQKSSE